jgi:hypothetical protein
MSGRPLWSVDDYLLVVEPHLAPALVSPSEFVRLRTLAAQLPPQSIVGFECRLAGDTRAADLAVALPAGSPGMRQLAGHGPHKTLVDELATHSAWRQIRALCTRACEPCSDLHGRVGTVWLEFDAQQHPGVPVPSVLFGLPSVEHFGTRGRRQAADSALELLTGEPLPRRVRDMLERCFSALPSSAHPFQLGVMLGRQASGVRVCVLNLSLDGIGDYLYHLDWIGKREELICALSPLTHHALRLALSIDVGEEIEPRIGIECYLHTGNRTRIEGRWVELLDLLVARGICHPDKRDGLLTWPGQTLMRYLVPITFARCLNHLKLIYRPGQPVQAKAYFGLFCVAQHAEPEPVRT